MPMISTFYGIMIYMYWGDHPPPHLHAIYAGEEAVLSIETGQVVAGSLSRRTLRLVQEWILLRREALLANWRRAETFVPLQRIPGPDDADPDQDS
jgi:hypothetical protein